MNTRTKRSRPWALHRDPSGVWIYRRYISKQTAMVGWWRWIRLWPPSFRIRKRADYMGRNRPH